MHERQACPERVSGTSPDPEFLIPLGVTQQVIEAESGGVGLVPMTPSEAGSLMNPLPGRGEGRLFSKEKGSRQAM